MTKEVDWWCHCKFLVTSITIGFLPVNCTQVTWASQQCYQFLSSFQKVPSFNFTPCLESWDATKVYWCKPSPHGAVKKPFRKGNENELVNIYIKRQHTKFIKLKSIFTSEVQWMTTCKFTRVYQASTFKLQIDQHVLICSRMV